MSAETFRFFICNMKRTNFPKAGKISYDKQDEPIVLSKGLMDILLVESNPANLIALYCFYYYTAKWQETNQPKATDSYCQKGLGWGYTKFVKAKKKLAELKLITIIQHRENGRIKGWFIRIHFIWKNKNTEILHQVNTSSSNYSINALSTINKNALSDNKENTIREKNKKYLPLAKHLLKTILSKKNIHYTPANIETWANDIRLLCETNKVSYQRIRTALKWYRIWQGGAYIPVIESGRSLRYKFLRLEDAIERNRDSEELDLTPQEIFGNYFKDKKDEAYVETFYEQYFQEALQLMPNENGAELAENMVSLYDWIGKNRENDIEQSFTTAGIIDYYIQWLGGQTWINDKTPSLFSAANKNFKTFVLRKSEESEYNIITGKFVK